MLKVILLAIVVVGIAVLGFAVKMFFIKGGTFTKTCASIDASGKQVPCSCKGGKEEECENYEKHHGTTQSHE